MTFANTIPGTVTGNSDSADYKDTVLANFEPVANCGTVIVKKTTIPAGQTGSFPYTLARQGALVRFAADALEHPEDGDAPQTQITRTLLADQASETHADLIPAANYTLQEGDVSPTWQLDSIICTVNGDPAGSDIKAGGTFAVEVGTITRCTITNRLALADLKIIKTVVNGSGLTKTPGDFTFSRDGGAAEPFANSDVSCTSGAVCKTISYTGGGDVLGGRSRHRRGLHADGRGGMQRHDRDDGEHVHHHQYRTAGAADDPDGPAGHPARFGEHRRRSPIRRRDRAAGDVRALSVAGGVQRRDGSARLRGQNR